MNKSEMKDRLKKIFFLFMIISFATVSFFFIRCGDTGGREKEISGQIIPSTSLPFSAGEKIQYAIKNLGIKMGEATLVYHGRVTLGNRDVHFIQFTARGFNFLDDEKIYADTTDFLPVKVERELNIFGKKEKIIEKYDQQNGTVVLLKKKGGAVTEQKIEKKGPLDNLYCFIYRTRRQGGFHVGESFSMRLPTKNVVIRLVKEVRLNAAGRSYKAYYMQSQPAKYKVWFDASEKKIPLRISGAVGINNTVMSMVSYAEKISGD